MARSYLKINCCRLCTNSSHAKLCKVAFVWALATERAGPARCRKHETWILCDQDDGSRDGDVISAHTKWCHAMRSQHNLRRPLRTCTGSSKWTLLHHCMLWICNQEVTCAKLCQRRSLILIYVECSRINIQCIDTIIMQLRPLNMYEKCCWGWALTCLLI